MKSFYYNDPPRVLLLALGYVSTRMAIRDTEGVWTDSLNWDDGLFPDVPDDDAQPNCYFCELPMYTLPRQDKQMGIGGGTYNDVCRTCALYEWGS